MTYNQNNNMLLQKSHLLVDDEVSIKTNKYI